MLAEPRTEAEIVARYRAARERLNPRLSTIFPAPETAPPEETKPEPIRVTSEFLSTSEAAAETKYKQQTIRNWCRDHGIAERHGGRWLVIRKRLYDYIETINSAPINSYQDRLRHELEMRKAASRQQSLFNRILAAVCLEWMVTEEELMSPRRLGRIVRARQVAMYLAIKLIDDWSLPRIGRRFHKDHTTVMHARDRIGELRNSDPDIADRVLRLEVELTMGPA
jgi:chromosomal replication initiation ATPase DnaA